MFKSFFKKAYFIYGVICLTLILLSSLFGSWAYETLCGGNYKIECRLIGFSNVFLSSKMFAEIIYTPLTDPYFKMVLIPLVISIMIFYTPAIHTLYKLLQKIIFKRQHYSKRQRKFAGFIIFLIVLPSLIVGGIIMSFIPPKFINTTITMDMWYEEFQVPRPYLEEWALFPNKSGFGVVMHQAKIEGEIPFLRFNVPIKTIEPLINSDGNIEIYTRPKSQSQIEKFINATINENLDKSLMALDKNKNPIYSTSVTNESYEVYQPLSSAEKTYESDSPFSEIIVLRDNKGIVQAYASCLPDTWCEKSNYNGLSEYYSYTHGKRCYRECGQGLNSEKYNITVKFDKKLISEYLNIQPKIIPFIESFASNKKQ